MRRQRRTARESKQALTCEPTSDKRPRPDSDLAGAPLRGAERHNSGVCLDSSLTANVLVMSGFGRYQGR